MQNKEFSWIEFVRNDDRFWLDIRSNLIGFVAFDPIARISSNLGTGFILGGAFHLSDVGPMYLAITAKHVVEDAYKFQDIAKYSAHRERRAPSAPSVFFNDITSIEETKLRAIWMGESHADMMRIRHISYAKNLDLAVCILEPQDHSKTAVEKEARGLLLDVSLPSVGDTVHLVGLTDFKLEGAFSNSGQPFTLHNRPFVREAKVLSIEESAMGHYGQCFRVSCPTVGGMSGGFVYKPGIGGSSLGVCGIISSSPQVQNANHFSTESDTSIASILGVLGLDLPFGDPSEKIRLFNLVKQGHLLDVSKSPSDFILNEFGNDGLSIQIL
ncbi:hypothetical protein [Undibacterium flavidum]|uniref:Trypsin-like peptidase n=1 Tax=Undibacterium flavidum TaxID=2762297 RepID=A0ABR6YBZ7_9BURK|nr:hypothetical protein [Undibacterium flavidum]MBC3873967.1 hypothetical protein [Undibacterium flavidum]